LGAGISKNKESNEVIIMAKKYILFLWSFFVLASCRIGNSVIAISTITPIPTISPTATPTVTVTPIPSTPTLSPIEQIVDEYLTAIEYDNWQVAYDLLCPDIQAVILTPDDMYRRILEEVGSIPDSHTFLPLPGRPNRVQFILSRTDGWATGVREARLEEGSLKICGVGASHGDLRYLLQTGDVAPLNINP
jgi:hypothetical protein